MKGLLGFIGTTLRLMAKGDWVYWSWIALLLLLVTLGAGAFAHQASTGLMVTNMRDQVSWGFYIGNFTFLVGVAAAAIMLVIPAYVYEWPPIQEITLLGELLALSALLMCLGFVLADLGRVDRFWHIIPLVGRLNWPHSMMAWDVIVLNLYLLLNWFVVTYLLYRAYTGLPYAMGFNLFLTAAEAFKEFYSGTHHMVHVQYLYFGLEGHRTLVPFARASLLLGVTAFVLLVVPRWRKRYLTLNLGCLFIFTSVYIEKGMGLIIPGLTPDALGEIYEYTPSLTELLVAAGIFAGGFLVFTLMLKAAVPIMLGEARGPKQKDAVLSAES